MNIHCTLVYLSFSVSVSLTNAVNIHYSNNSTAQPHMLYFMLD